jgi:uncharacterized protein
MSSLCLSEIWIYPIKSLGGIRLETAEVMPKGLKYDRRWMLVDSNGDFLTQRELHQMALFKLALVDENLLVTHKEDKILIPISIEGSKSKGARIWDDNIIVNLTGDHYDRWFSEKLGMDCHLVQFPEANPRQIDQKYAKQDEHVSLADGYPFLIIGQSSLDDLNQKLDKPVPMNRFRPNFVFTGANEFAEDSWKIIRIGSVVFNVVKPCARCVLTTVDQDTGITSNEPLRTLASYRKQNNKVLFGQNMIALQTGSIKQNDRIEIIE